MICHSCRQNITKNAVDEGKVTSLAKRKTLKAEQSPFESKENGEMGTSSVYFGSRKSKEVDTEYMTGAVSLVLN